MIRKKMTIQWLLLPVLFLYGRGGFATDMVYQEKMMTTEKHLGKQIIGQTAHIDLPVYGIHYLARIDTGARITSIHARDIKVIDGVRDQKANIGKIVIFSSMNEKGEKARIEAKIVDVAKVRNAQGWSIVMWCVCRYAGMVLPKMKK